MANEKINRMTLTLLITIDYSPTLRDRENPRERYQDVGSGYVIYVVTAEPMSLLLMEDIIPAFAPPGEIVNSVSNQGAEFGSHNRTHNGQKNL